MRSQITSVWLNISPSGPVSKDLNNHALSLRKSSPFFEDGTHTKGEMLTAYTLLDDIKFKAAATKFCGFTIQEFDTHYTLQFCVQVSSVEDIKTAQNKLAEFVDKHFTTYIPKKAKHEPQI